MATAPADTERWSGEGVTLGQIERELVRLRTAASEATHAPFLRTSVLTHIAWVPAEWLEAATEVYAGLGERHPSRVIWALPEPDGERRLDAELALVCYPIGGSGRKVCTELIKLRLGDGLAKAPASIVEPLVIADLPTFLRWRGRPSFGSEELTQMLGLVDRLVVDSVEWPELPDSYERLGELFDRVVVSDIAWRRTLGWRRSVAALWPGVAQARELRVRGPEADARLLAGWLRSRLDRGEIELAHEPAETIEGMAVDGEPVAPPHGEAQTGADLLSEQLEIYERDRIYEAAVARAF